MNGDQLNGAMSIPGYEAFQAVGRGGFATVYRARQVGFDRQVAVKVIELGFDDVATRRRFERECTASGRLTGHPNILSILDSGVVADGRPYLTMPFCPGGSLADLVARSGPMSVEDALRVGVKIAGALQTAHNHGVVHRDIKPENILRTEFGEPALADFGIATVALRTATKRTQAYTPTHAPPEVLLGELASTSSDIYTLGSTLYEVLAGAPAFADTGYSGLALFVDHVLNSEPAPLRRDDAPPSLSRVLATAMAKKPENRYPSAADFGHALQDVQRELDLPATELVVGGPAAAAPAAPPEPTPAPALTALGERAQQYPTSAVSNTRLSNAGRSRSRKPLIAAAALAVLLLLGGGVAAAVLWGGGSDGSGGHSDEFGGGYGNDHDYEPEYPSLTRTTSGHDESRSGGGASDEGAAQLELADDLCPSGAELRKTTGKDFPDPVPFDPPDIASGAEDGIGCSYDAPNEPLRFITFYGPGITADDIWPDGDHGAPVIVSGTAVRASDDFVALEVDGQAVLIGAEGERDVALAMAAVVVGRQ